MGEAAISEEDPSVAEAAALAEVSEAAAEARAAPVSAARDLEALRRAVRTDGAVRYFTADGAGDVREEAWAAEDVQLLSLFLLSSCSFSTVFFPSLPQTPYLMYQRRVRREPLSREPSLIPNGISMRCALSTTIPN